MSSDRATIFVVDDDEAVRDSLAMLIGSVGHAVETFASAQDFLRSFRPGRPGCLVLDIRMPGLSGLDLQERLKERQISLPIVFITGHGDVPMAVRALKAGAVDFLQKPFSDQDLLDRIHTALQIDGERRSRAGRRRAVEQRLSRLTARERQVLDRVVSGASNKVIAGELGLSQRTVEIHRANVMKKMRADSLAKLVSLVLDARERGRPPAT